MLTEQAAIEWVKSNRQALARKYTDLTKYPAETNPVSVFMAGSPGAGKTEIARALARRSNEPLLHIDPDIYRADIPGYTGNNSAIVQGAAVLIMERVHDLALKNKQSFILDGTFSDTTKARQNIQRSLNKDRDVVILYVWQPPAKAWEFVVAREKVEGRAVHFDKFAAQFIAARETVLTMHREFDKNITIQLITPNAAIKIRPCNAIHTETLCSLREVYQACNKLPPPEIPPQ